MYEWVFPEGIVSDTQFVLVVVFINLIIQPVAEAFTRSYQILLLTLTVWLLLLRIATVNEGLGAAAKAPSA